MKFIHTGDFHIGATLSKASFARKEDLIKRRREIEGAFERLLDAIQERDVEYLFITGDLFDHAQVALSKIDHFFNRLASCKAEVFIVIGNHDTFLHNQAYAHIRDLKNIHFLDAQTDCVKHDDVHVYGLSTRDFDESKLMTMNAHLDETKINVLCLHGDVFNKQDDHYLTDVKTLASLHFDYIALGHIHKHEFLHPHIAYSGNLEPLDFSETAPRGYIEGTLGKPIKARFVEFAKRRFMVKSLTLTKDDTYYTLEKKLQALFTEEERTTHFTRVILTGTMSRDIKLTDSDIDNLKEPFYALDINDETKHDLNLTQLKKDYKDTIIDHLITAYQDDLHDEESLLLALDALLSSEGGSR